MTDTRPDADLASQINAAHRKAEASTRHGMEKALEWGRLLMQAKQQREHGSWQQGIADHFEGSKQSAQRHMQPAKQYHELPQREAPRVTNLSLREAGKAISTTLTKAAQVSHEVPCRVQGRSLKEGVSITRARAGAQPRVRSETDEAEVWCAPTAQQQPPKPPSGNEQRDGLRREVYQPLHELIAEVPQARRDVVAHALRDVLRDLERGRR